jgi:hypothetical protein
MIELVITELETKERPVLRVPHDEIKILISEPAAKAFSLYLPRVAYLSEHS